MEDEVGVLLGHCADLGDVVSHYHVEQGEVGGRSVRQVTHGQTGRLAAVLVNLTTGAGREGGQTGRQGGDIRSDRPARRDAR